MKYEAIEAFETFKRTQEMPVKEYTEEFNRKYQKVKSYNITIPDDILGYRLLKSCALSSRDEQILKATITSINITEIKTKLSKIYSEGPVVKSDSPLSIKSEPTFNTCSNTDFQAPNEGYTNYEISDESDENEDDFDVFYSNQRYTKINSNRNLAKCSPNGTL